MREQPSLAEVLTCAMQEHGFTLERLARASGVPKQTIHRWSEGGVTKPYFWDNLLQVAATLGLNQARTNRLLRAAGLPLLDTLRASGRDERQRALLAHWTVTTPHNLPSPLTTFLGRDDELLDLADLLSRPAVRLLTLTGPGGSGKTRLGLEVARAVLDSFADGVYLVELASLADPTLVLPSIARTLEIRVPPGQRLADRLSAYLRERQILLLLDNFEQVVTAGAQITALLAAAPRLTVLVTSRLPLHVSGEHESVVLPLPAPPTGARLADLAANPAVALFLARAQAVAPRLTLTKANAPAVAALCTRLDGLPLALELAAARTRQFTPEALLARFTSALDLGSDGPRDVLPRRQTLRATIRWSTDLLTLDEQILFARLAVFRGGWTAAAAMTVCAEAQGRAVDVPSGLTALYNASLIGRSAGPAPDGEPPRYAMLETIREYALEQLTASGEEEAIRERHAAWLLRVLPPPALYVPSVQQEAWLQALEPEADNLRAALDWALLREHGELVAQLAGAAWPFWHETTHFAEGNRWLRAALDTGAALRASPRAPLLTGALVLTFSEGHYARCVALGEEAVALWTKLDNPYGLALTHLYQALTSQNRGEPTEALAAYQQALAHWRVVGDPAGLINCLSHLAIMLAQYGQFAAAESYFAEIHHLCIQHGDDAGLARWAIDRGLSIMMQGDFAGARQLLQEGLARSRAQRHPFNLPAALSSLGLATLLDNEPAEALGYLVESLRLRRESGDGLGIAYCLIGIAGVANKTQQAVRAAQLCGAATALVHDLGAALPPAPSAVYERELANVRAQLDAATFARAWTEGQALPLERAIAIALATEAQPGAANDQQPQQSSGRRQAPSGGPR